MSQIWACNLFGVCAALFAVPVFMYCIQGAAAEARDEEEEEGPE